MSIQCNRSWHPLGSRLRISRIHCTTKQKHNLKTVDISCFQRTKHACKNESFHSSSRQKVLVDLVLMGFAETATFYSRQSFAFFTSVFVKKYAHLSLKKTSNMVVKRESRMKWDETIYGRKASFSWKRDSEWWKLYNTTNNVEQQMRKKRYLQTFTLI